jgi:mannose-1-phosphate guanylyltransferase
MSDVAERWSLILAAGSGTRLHSLTSDGYGRAVPKQFCSLNGGSSLLEEAFTRARAFSTEQHTLVVVAAEHRAHWQHALAGMHAENVIVQPVNKGTANGILLGAAAILERDPQALVTVLPSDHYVAHEDVLRRSLSRAFALAESETGARAIHFLGIEPEHADPELGYIVPGAISVDGSVAIARFVEKPNRELASDLRRRGALWNSFVVVARASALVGLIERRFPVEARAFASLWRKRRPDDRQRELERLYASLRDIDFSRHVVEGADAPLRVVPVPYCGWSDLGTPKRVADCLKRFDGLTVNFPSRHFNLAEGYARLMSTVTAAAQQA